jgi:hypothetical protein
MNNALENNDATWLRDLWIGSFTGICGSPLLWENQHRRDLWPHFGKLNAFMSGYNFDESENGQKGWVPFHDYDAMHSGSGVNKYGVSDLFYLRSPDKENAIGIIANRTYNFFTQWDCQEFPFDTTTSRGMESWESFYGTGLESGTDTTDDGLYTTPRVSQYTNEHIFVKNLKGYPTKRYIIEYFSVWNPSVVIKSETKRNDNWNGLKLEFPATTGTNVRTLVLVKVKPFKDKSLESNDSIIEDSIQNYSYDDFFNNEKVTPNQSKPKVYPNPSFDILNIELSIEQSGATVRLYDLSGRILIDKEVFKKFSSIDVRDLSAGTYVLELWADSELYHFKINKQ